VSVPFLWVIRNYHLTKHFPVLAVGGQHFMWSSHNEHIYEVYQRRESPDIIGHDPRYPMEPLIKVSDFFKISPTEQVKLGNQCSNVVRSWITGNKCQVLKYSFLKLKRFLSWELVFQKADLPLQNLRVFVYSFTEAPITIFGWMGLAILFLKKKKTALFFAAVTIGFVLIHVISLFGSRHKIPLDALFITLMPLAVHCLYSKIENLSKRIVKAYTIYHI